jgi:hypothetical protein
MSITNPTHMPLEVHMNSAPAFYPRAPRAQPFDDDRPALGAAIVALSQLAGHVDLGFRRGSINPHVADRIVVEIDRIGAALNAMVPRPSP